MITRKRVKAPLEKVSEKLVVHIWQQQICSNLVADNGERVKILYPGRPTGDRGRDFSDAVISVGGVIITGDIEVHVKSSQWYAHGHHRDPVYNNIVLHVVMWNDDERATILQNGHCIPTVCLHPFLTRPLSELCATFSGLQDAISKCPRVNGYSVRSLIDVLSTAGRQRFDIKAAKIHSELTGEEPGQVLYRNLARALGYTRNTVPFERLAEKVPLTVLEGYGRKFGVLSRAFVLGMAGLLPSQRFHINSRLIECEEIEQLEEMWQSWDITETMAEADWCFYRVRPGNFPTRRLVALSFLITRYRYSGLLNGLLEVIDGLYGKGIYHRIEDSLEIRGHGYWAYHFDFGSKKAARSALLGRSKAGELAINVVLPFIWAWGDLTSNQDMKKNALNLYIGYPGLTENQITRYMKRQLFPGSRVALSACMQQGLLHIFRTSCRCRNCRECPVALNRC